ncbi:MAG: hypothetical protein JNK05_30475 [Myxococcales bacterium]|nr:hypothetical protein [Myxococcales bacterium]
MGDAAAPNDATPPPADVQSSVRPGRYPDRSLVTCSRWIMHRMTVPPPLDGCRPWVGFVGPHPRETTRQFVGASVCGHALIVDPTQATQRNPFSFIPPGQSFVRGGVSIMADAAMIGDVELSVWSQLQLGNGIQPVIYNTRGPLDVRNATGLNSSGSIRLPDPRTHIVTSVRYQLDPTSPVPGGLIVAEIPEAQMDGTFRVRRFLRGGLGNDPQRELAPIVRSTGVPQPEGTTSSSRAGIARAAITCAAADGKLVVEVINPATRDSLFPAYDTGDPTLQRCSLSNVNGTILLVASSETRSIAFTLDVRPMTGGPMVEFIPFAQQPNFLPVDRAQLGRDEGPFDVTVAATLDNAPATLVLYTRRAMAGAADVPTFAFVDRLFDYESTPESPQFIPSPTPTVGAMYAAAFWPTGQVAFARFDPRTGVLDASTAQCDR